MNEAKKWIDWCYNNGYRCHRSGPKPVSFMRYDMKKFKIVAEKILSDKKGKI